MPHITIPRPEPTEYAPAFASYVDRVPPGDLSLAILTEQLAETIGPLEGLSDSEAGFRYAPGKWSIKQVLGHLIDTERIMIYRALCFARGETVMLPGFDEDAYVAHAKFDRRSLADLISEFRLVRAATIPFFAGLDPEELARCGVANSRPYSVRAVAYIIAGHERHHAAILRERYLSTRHAR
jgi:hypothetical protein